MGNVISRIYEWFTNFGNKRRIEKYGIDRSRPDHPERLPPDCPILVEDNTQTGTVTKPVTIIDNEQFESSTIQAPASHHEQNDVSAIQNPTIDNEQTIVTNTTIPSIECSVFYLACRNNDIETVTELLETISQDEIDQVEPNGSTALHAASYHGHAEIVQLLLKKGADRSVRNKYNYLPFDEAPTNEIRELFNRIPSSNRLVMDSDAIQWEFIDDDASHTAMVQRETIRFIYKTVSLDKMFEKIETSYIGKRLANTDKIESTKHFFQKATKTKDPIWIIKAYTAETDFYNVLNAEIASGASQYENERKYIMALLIHHPKLNELSHINTCYRVMKITDYDLQQYEINKLTMTKSFLSSSMDEDTAVTFLYRQEMKRGNNETKVRHNKYGILINKSWVMCKYQIKYPRTALHIENSSQYTAEAEVLIMPYTVFKIKNKEMVSRAYLPVEHKMTVIEFEECDPYAEVQIQET